MSSVMEKILELDDLDDVLNEKHFFCCVVGVLIT